MVFGMATTAVGNAGKPFFIFFNSANEIIMRILRWFVWLVTFILFHLDNKVFLSVFLNQFFSLFVST
jgi:Na+/H+-dicarboxylate symporter